MELNTDILRSMIKEEISKSLITELKEEEEAAVTQIVSLLTRLDADGMNTDNVMGQVQQQFKASQGAAQSTAVANRADEKLDKDATAGDYVKDFRKSDAPQFKGKSKKKKQEMAIAAYLGNQDD